MLWSTLFMPMSFNGNWQKLAWIDESIRNESNNDLLSIWKFCETIFCHFVDMALCRAYFFHCHPVCICTIPWQYRIFTVKLSNAGILLIPFLEIMRWISVFQQRAPKNINISILVIRRLECSYWPAITICNSCNVSHKNIYITESLRNS